MNSITLCPNSLVSKTGTGRRLFLLAILLLSGSCFGQSSSSPAHRRAAHLRHGINLSEWFAQVYDPKGYTKEHFENWTTADDIALIKSMGFDHVRLSVNPEPMMRHNRADELPPEYLGYVDAAVRMILDRGLAVIIDMHPESEFKARLVQHDDFVEQFSDFWRAIARHYSSYDPEMVYFEILNEPEFRDRYRWSGVQAKLATAIREGAPQHTIIAAGANYSDVADLLALTPLPDANVIYNFHFYDPHTFTHQGATWTSSDVKSLKGIVFPGPPTTPFVPPDGVKLGRGTLDWLQRYNTLPAEQNPCSPFAFRRPLQQALQRAGVDDRPDQFAIRPSGYPRICALGRRGGSA